MQLVDFTDLQRKNLVKLEGRFWAYVPPVLPPASLKSETLWALSSRADRAIGELAGVGRHLRNPHLLIRPFVRREAVLSSQIEGTQSTQQDLLLFEIAPERSSGFDVQEVNNYVRALDYALAREPAMPVSRRLLCEMHGILMEAVRGEKQRPGEVRRTQNWIGPEGCAKEEATYVPPPVPQMEQALDDLSKYIHAPSNLPPLVRLALVHYQFEAIHPFDDGNGRLGRLLITTLLCVEKILPQPLLYLSAYFMKHRSRYYELLLQVSTSGNWTAWIEFFLNGVIEQSKDAIERANALWALRDEYKRRLENAKSPSTQFQLIDRLFETPATTGLIVAKQLGVTPHTAYNAIDALVAMNILEEVTGQKRNRVYLAREVMEKLR